MIKYIRYVLYAAIVAISFMLFNAWQAEHPSVSAQTAVQQQQNGAVSTTVTHNVNQVVQLTNQTFQSIPKNRVIDIQTDVLDIKIDTLGGNIVQASLLKYPITLNSDKPYLLLNDEPNNLYVVQSGLTKSSIVTDNQHLAQYKSSQTSFSLKPGDTKLVVNLSGTQDGMSVEKNYVFYPKTYAIDVTYNIKNNSGKSWVGNYYMQIVHDVDEQTTANGFLTRGLHSFEGVAIYTPENKYEQFKSSKLQEEPLNSNVSGGWIATPQHYFLSAWVPSKEGIYHFYSQVTADSMYTVGMIGHQMTIDPSKTVQLASKLFVGPKLAKQLDAAAPLLSHTIDYGWMWFISILLFKALAFINHFVGNWGWSIVIITLLIKLVFYKLSETSYVSMARMRTLQPKMQQLKERYKDDKEGMSKTVMGLYKSEKVNPLGGCLPILIQIPVFFALYYVLLQSVELRQAPFIFWITDLAVKDPYYILPILMGLTMFAQQKLSPAPPDAAQAKLMLFLPVLMTIIFVNFPAGLVLYWFTNNLLSIMQQWVVTYRCEHGHYPRRKKREWKKKK